MNALKHKVANTSQATERATSRQTSSRFCVLAFLRSCILCILCILVSFAAFAAMLMAVFISRRRLMAFSVVAIVLIYSLSYFTTDNSLSPDHNGNAIRKVNNRVIDTPTPLRPDSRPPSNPSAIMFAKDEKFLAYMPHSGFHNQRIALEVLYLLRRKQLVTNKTALLFPVLIACPLPLLPLLSAECPPPCQLSQSHHAPP